MLPRIFSLSSSLAPLSAMAHCELSTFFSTVWMSLSRQFVDVLEDEHQAPDLFDQFRVFLSQVFQQIAFGGAIGHVQDFGDACHPARILELLAHHADHARFQPLFDLSDHFRIGLSHLGDALDHRQLPSGGKPAMICAP